MPDERIKVIFNRVFVKNDADWFGSGEFYFIATVDGAGAKADREAAEARSADSGPEERDDRGSGARGDQARGRAAGGRGVSAGD